MNNSKGITYISVDKLVPHPNNPRKDVGDVTELADSIKVNGIFQNLTVVPFEGVGERYTVIIGHRRLAAAKQAGLQTVPCVITEMDEREQVSTMLLENMQRSDLTVYEQAEGFQMMFDFGETVASVAEKTGFSQSTVRRRKKLLELDKEKFRESTLRGATLDDYMKLDKLESVERKNDVLEFIGTQNFEWKLNEALRQEEHEKIKAEIINALSDFADPLEGSLDDFECLEKFNDFEEAKDYGIPEDADEVKYYYLPRAYGTVELYRERTVDDKADEADAEEQEKKRELEICIYKLRDIQKTAYELRQNYVYNLGAAKVTQHKELICAISVYADLYGCSLYDYTDIAERITDIEKGGTGKTEILEYSKKNPVKAALLLAWEKMDNEYNAAHDYHGEYIPNNSLILIYDYLMKIGYEMSDEEAEYVYGAHELFVKPENTETQNE